MQIKPCVFLVIKSDTVTVAASPEPSDASMAAAAVPPV